eukprot:TRINITY_DN65956_c0_g1_i1.p1 TRINITY_DN65956_c0_g1~~TRINITY_DN65956_c0_g1_i1.p1  ORF type:complete len:191 (-),score=27.16 TRINITY_DN65956_c0_g1_i1:15-587(-)
MAISLGLWSKPPWSLTTLEASAMMLHSDEESFGSDSERPLQRQPTTLGSRVFASLVLAVTALGAVALVASTKGWQQGRSAVQASLRFDELRSECFQKGWFYANPSQLPGSARSVEVNATSCQRRCEEVKSCMHVTYWPDGGCLLTGMGSILQLASDEYSQVLSGPKYCSGDSAVSSLLTYDPSIDAPPVA